MTKLSNSVTVFIAVLLTYQVAVPAAPADTTGLRSLLNQGIAHYNAEKYWDARQIFQTINARPQAENPFLTTSALMLVKTNYHLGEAETSESLARKFLKDYPDSKYAGEVKKTLAEVLLSQGKYQEALLVYLSLLEICTDQELLNSCEDYLDKLLDFYLSSAEIRTLQATCANDFCRQYLTIKLAEKLHNEGDTKQALTELNLLPGRLDNKYLRDQFQIVEQQLKKPAVSRKYIGVILPLTGANANVGQKILKGLKYAIDDFRKNSGINVVALVLDNRGDGYQSIRQAEFLAKNPRVLAIFGPVLTENAALVAVIANQYHIPMLTPTASGSQLTALGPYIFQANVDYENLGHFLGMYSARVGRVKTVASVSSADEFGKEFTDAYCRAIDEYGGQVVSQQWYQGEPADLKYQVDNIRLTAIDRFVAHFDEKYNLAKNQLVNLARTDPRFRNDTLRIAVGDQQCLIFKPDTTYRLSIPETLIMTGLMQATDFEIPKRDTTTFPHGLVDGFLLPARANDASLIVPQLVYYDIRGKLYGSANWNDPDLLKKNRDILQELRFISDYYIDTDSRRYKTVAADFLKKMGSEPGRIELYGFDTMNALLSVVKDTPANRESIRRGLLEMPVYRGICRNISFQGNRPRVNSCAYILGYEREKVRPVAVIENGNLIGNDSVR